MNEMFSLYDNVVLKIKIDDIFLFNLGKLIINIFRAIWFYLIDSVVHDNADKKLQPFIATMYIVRDIFFIVIIHCYFSVVFITVG